MLQKGIPLRREGKEDDAVSRLSSIAEENNCTLSLKGVTEGVTMQEARCTRTNKRTMMKDATKYEGREE